jgi:hypothetical protein
MPDEKAPSSGAFLPASLMYFCSGQPMHFCCGVDTHWDKAEKIVGPEDEEFKVDGAVQDSPR